jgi:hypothetical protein
MRLFRLATRDAQVLPSGEVSPAGSPATWKGRVIIAETESELSAVGGQPTSGFDIVELDHLPDAVITLKDWMGQGREEMPPARTV